MVFELQNSHHNICKGPENYIMIVRNQYSSTNDLLYMCHKEIISSSAKHYLGGMSGKVPKQFAKNN
jgi:hypothetical protein